METSYDAEFSGVGSKQQQGIRLQSIFQYDSDAITMTSSGRKRILRGRYVGDGNKDVAACALVYRSSEIASFGLECANLSMCSMIGVGPRLLDIAEARVGDDARLHPVIIEEDVGESLARLLRDTSWPARSETLHPIGTPERETENKKIAFDIFSQVFNAHRANLYHRDLRCENVCIRRFGDRPQDIRATVIDIELGAGLNAGQPEHRAALYYTLFRSIPTMLGGGVLGTKSESVVIPTPLEMDLGYLAALLFHVERGVTVLNDPYVARETIEAFLAFIEEKAPFFGYAADTMALQIRRLEESDIRSIATGLGLREVCQEEFPVEGLLRQARSYNRLYLDAEDVRSFEQSAVARMYRIVDKLVLMEFEKYKERRKAQGERIEYERLEDQPEDLRSSNYDQMAHIFAKVAALGYITTDVDACSASDRVLSLTDEQVEVLARMEHARWVRERLSKGWVLGERCAEAKTSPYLVPYDSLSEEMKDYDRDTARSVIPMLEIAGIAVVEPPR
ncbi:MAG: hypothetical protein IKG18_14110 [Atopobiaceae bacterium]|nr:hypothetical protein [Atopobiaceae bacterium]